MGRLLCGVAVAAVLVAACGDDDAPQSATSTTAEPTTGTSPGDPSTSSPSTSEPPVELSRACTSPAGFTVSYPADWEAVGGCRQFGPAPLEEPAPATDERPGVVAALVDPVAFAEVSRPADGDEDRQETTIDGRPAVRIEGVTSGEGLQPAGIRTVRWLVDASAAEGEPATFVADTFDTGYDLAFEDAVEVLDAMVASVDLP